LVSVRKYLGLALVAISLCVAVGAATSLLVANGADEVAESQPYCIQVADGTSDYRPARSWLDLSIFTMWAKTDGPLYMQHHAILVVAGTANPRLYHWSYRRHAFELGVLNGEIEGDRPAITCVPARDFVAKRLALFPKPSDSNYIRYSARDAYRIPNAWQAEWSGGMSPTLRLATTAPDFQPLNRRWSDLTLGERDSNWVFVEWNPEWVLSLTKAAPGGVVVEHSTEFGLSMSKTITRGKDGKEHVGYRYLAYDDGRGINTTVIGCGTPSEAVPKSCQHRFINRERHFYFRHRPEEVADWKAMQQRIVALMDAFEVPDAK
jgi:hypothetical protein